MYVSETVRFMAFHCQWCLIEIHSLCQGFEKVQSALGTRLNFSTTFHPQIDGQSEIVMQVLEDMFLGCVLDFPESWDRYIPLMEFSYNNGYQSSIGIAAYEALYGRKHRTPVC